MEKKGAVQKIFSPTNKPIKDIIKSLIYFAITFIVGYSVWLKFLGENLIYSNILHPDIYLPILIGLIIVPLVLSYIVHRPYKKGIVFAGAVFILFLIFYPKITMNL